MNHDSYSDDYIAAILNDARTFAFVGASASSNRPSYFAMKYLLGKGYHVIPVNPGHAGQQILGQTVYGALADVPGPVDVIDIFRNAQAALGVAREAIALKDKLGLEGALAAARRAQRRGGGGGGGGRARRRHEPLPQDRVRPAVG